MFWWLAHSQWGRAASEYGSMDVLQIAPVSATATNSKRKERCQIRILRMSQLLCLVTIDRSGRTTTTGYPTTRSGEFHVA
ncbi:hypothetical protein N7517_003611 [Penicillium concentricum]|uniref:Uncharacterized protein n=1 Tax=Penicillium concentricum TaxID=293559 RepID=A0A9W9V9R8_9EURO|nr:uncharacterized protein N7517_003611 [Penicillium concentricum]KAJ5371605.1 hypothetical protein N7517_003611 [Penicillium concentricum]